MEREGSKKKMVFNMLKEGPKTRKHLLKYVKRQTLDYIVKKYKDQIREVDGRYELIELDRLGPDEEVEDLINLMRDGAGSVREIAAFEFAQLCTHKTITQPGAIDFMSDAINKKDFEKILPQLIESMYRILGTAQRDNNREMLAKIITEKNIDNMIKIAQSDIISLEARSLALQFLWLIKDPNAYPIFPKLLENLDQEIYPKLQSDIKWGFKVYSRIVPSWVRRDLYSLLSKKDIEDRVKEILLETIAERYKS